MSSRLRRIVFAWIAIVVACRERIDTPHGAIRRMADASEEAPARSVALRLTGFPHRPRTVDRGAKAEVYALRAVADGVAAAYAHASNPGGLHAAAIAALLRGEADAAVTFLERAVRLDADDGRLWNDLAAARVAAAELHDDVELLCSALAAADAAIRKGERASGTFNRALILSRMGLEDPAARAVEDLSAIDPDSPWTVEARALIHRPRASAADDWKRHLPGLARAVAGRDDAAVRSVVGAYPQEARAWTETIFLGDWAAAHLERDREGAEKQLALASATAEALHAFRGEALARDAVHAVRTASPDKADLLARAHRDYFEARKLYEARDVARAHALFVRAQAGFERGDSPLAAVARYYVASCIYDEGRGGEALVMLREILERTPEGHQALRAQLLWEIGTVHSRAGMLHEASAAQSRSHRLFTVLGERGNANIMLMAAAATDAALGRHNAAWRARIDAFRAMSERGDAAALQRALDVTARTEILAGRWDNAHSLLEMACEEGLRRNPRIFVSSAMWRALAAHRLGIANGAEDVALARNAAGALRDPSLRRRAVAGTLFVDAVLIRESEPRRAVDLLTSFIDGAVSERDLFLLPEALLERARAYRELRDPDAALADLREAHRVLAERRKTMPRDEIRDAYFRTAESVVGELASGLVAVGAAREALDLVDAQRNESYPNEALGVLTARQRLRGNQVVIAYVALDRQLLLFILTKDELRTAVVPVGAAELESEVTRLTEAAEGGHAVQTAKVSQWLIEPAATGIGGATDLVFVPDRVLMRVPFAMLRIRGRMLVERSTVTVAPSLSVAFARRPPAPPARVVSVGDPAFDRGKFPALPRLPEAAHEARRVAALYHDATVLTGAEATRSAVLGAFETASIANIASHAIAIPNDPMRSHLVLASAPDGGGALYVHDIVRSRTRLELVMLPGCRTAIPGSSRRNVDTLALAFLAAGTANVVGTLWNVDDHVAARFSIAFHERLLAGDSPAAALREVQNDMRARDASIQARDWATFQIYGNANERSQSRSLQEREEKNDGNSVSGSDLPRSRP